MGVAFKEWAIVCDALGSGQQCILLRKGGIAEGRDGFAFREREFFLFPTAFHESSAKTTLPAGFLERWESRRRAVAEGEIEICYSAVVEWSRLVTDRAVLHRLRGFHVLADETLDARWRYDSPEGVHIAFVRVYRLDPPVRILDCPAFGGCRSWVEIPDSSGCALVSVLSDEAHADLKARVEAAVGAIGN